MKLYAAALDFEPIAQEFGVQRQVPEAARKEAERLAAEGLPPADRRADHTDIPFVTIDPPGSKDLDQAVFIKKLPDGFKVLYAIADVAAFAEFGRAPAVRAVSFERGQTIYLPDGAARLHPEAISEGVASLLPQELRPVVLWSIDLDLQGEVRGVQVERSTIRSRAQLTYEQVERWLGTDELPEAIVHLEEVGKLRQASHLRREAINLRLPAQRVEITDGKAHLVAEPRYRSMDYNSEISLLAGMCAGQMMAQAGVGVLRTLPAATADAVQEFRAEARALGVAGAQDTPITQIIDELNVDTPQGLALMRVAQGLLRGSDYQNLSTHGAELHAGVGGFYSHVTAPLRRLIDRYATEFCLNICAGAPVPEWAREGLDEAIATMRRTGQLASAVDRACLDLTEASVLQESVGEIFNAVVLSSNGKRAHVLLHTPPVMATCEGQLAAGSQVQVRLVEADPQSRSVTFTAGPPTPPTPPAR
ncbi:RNB domain-containing ribonuclease [Corynebacterium sp. 153RC1]|uniref:RNB domain-containing ribonuclease n=1 Tax=unclassified Corynebacterium TaxID=2624378 RepID=UPI00211B788D|nr:MULTISPECIES: RNB domain-containing ribonuclease [unclassified Corynebacterium]MCQ9352318.1 RNB domain-containing ribonuclease [Corynebacterium sp. 209RC1]MCQ9360526.1 RNB domain-containing ribonuclease [Corynebacterium sp. 153RC1]